jgi:hypothetical protein
VSSRNRARVVPKPRNLRQKLRLLQYQTMRQFLEVAREQCRAAECAMKNEMRGALGWPRRKPLEQLVHIDETGSGPRQYRALVQKGGASKRLPRHLHEDDGAALRVYSQRTIIVAREESRDVALVIDRRQMSHPAN